MQKSFTAIMFILLMAVSVVAQTVTVPELYQGDHYLVTVLVEYQGDLEEMEVEGGILYFVIERNKMIGLTNGAMERSDSISQITKVVNAKRKIGSNTFNGINIFSKGVKDPTFITYLGKDDDGDKIFVSTFIFNGARLYAKTWIKE